MTGRAGAALWAAAVLATAACNGAPDDAATAARAPAISTSLTPRVLWIGTRAVARIGIELPPGHRVLRVVPPEPSQGFEVLDDAAPAAAVPGADGTLEILFPLRGLRAGTWQWTGSAVEVADGEGRRTALVGPAVPVEVRSILGEFPGRTAPFGARAAPPLPEFPLGWIAAAGAAIAAAAALGAAIRRRRRRGPGPAAVGAAPPWTRAREGFARARSALAADTTAAADTAAATLRDYMIGRFGAAARAATTEELAVATPPFGATSRWPDFVALMRELDAVRFPRAGGPGQRATLEALVRRAERFVEGSLPPEPLR